jgi:hypothetical protein
MSGESQPEVCYPVLRGEVGSGQEMRSPKNNVLDLSSRNCYSLRPKKDVLILIFLNSDAIVLDTSNFREIRGILFRTDGLDVSYFCKHQSVKPLGNILQHFPL